MPAQNWISSFGMKCNDTLQDTLTDVVFYIHLYRDILGTYSSGILRTITLFRLCIRKLSVRIFFNCEKQDLFSLIKDKVTLTKLQQKASEHLT